MAVRWQGMAVGFLALTLLDVVVSSQGASSKLGGLATGAGTVTQKILSPTVPAFGSTTKTSSSSSPPSSSSSGSAVLASVPLASSPVALT